MPNLIVHVIDHNTVHKALIARLIVQKIPNVTQITFAKTHDAHDAYVAAADLVIVSGGTWLAQKNPGTHRRLNDLLIESGKPIVGICLGAEALAQYFGMELVALDRRVSGVFDVQLEAPLQAHLGVDTLPVYEHHIYAIPEANDQVEVLARSPIGIEAFKHVSRPIWGVQFHPEVQRGHNQGYRFFEYVWADINSSL